jgi:hypothetical protein
VREPARETTFRVVVAVVTALLLTNFIIIVYFVHPAFNPDEDDDGEVNPPEPEGDWLTPTEPEVLDEDTSMLNEDGFLERPQVVTSGNELTIAGSHIRIHLEDLLFWLEPAFAVEPNATMTVHDSTIEVVQDPRHAASVVGAYRRPDHNPPYIARVVNLDRANDPVFHMDVQWLGNVTPLAVGVVPAGSDELVLLETFAPEEAAPHSWMHKEVGLSDYVGTRPWVVVWFHSYPDGPVFVGNLSVMDGDAWPEGDMFPTGHPVKDGWLVSRFSDIPTIQRFRGYPSVLEKLWQPLIYSEGSVSISDSTIVEPPGMGRKAQGEVSKEEIDPDGAMRYDQIGAHGGHIGMVGGGLSIMSSEIQNAPITGMNSTLMAQATTFSGDHDLVSLFRPGGSFHGCTFLTLPLSQDNPFNTGSSREPWDIGVEGAMPGFTFVIDNNTFDNSHTAIDLSHARVLIQYNTFRHIHNMAVWNHASQYISWEELSAQNTFEDIQYNIYLNTTVTDVEFVHPDNETDEIQVYPTGSQIQTWMEIAGFGLGDLQSFYGNTIRYVVPRKVVKAWGEVQQSQLVRAEVRWNHMSEHYTFSPSDPHITVDLSQLFGKGPISGLPYNIQLGGVSEGTSPGSTALLIKMKSAWSLTHADPTMRFSVDGVLFASVPISEDDILEDGSAVVRGDIALLSGWRELNVTVWGREPLEGGGYATEPSLLAQLSQSLLMVSEDNDIEPWMPLAVDCIIVPGNGTWRLDLGEPPELIGSEYRTVRVLGWNGSNLVMDGSALEGRARTDLSLQQNVSLSLENARFSSLGVSEEPMEHRSYWRGAPVSLTNVSAPSLFVSGLGRDLDLTDLRAYDNLYVQTSATSNVTLSGCMVDNGFTYVSMWDGAVLIENCTFSSNWSDSVWINPFIADTTVRDCAFSGAGLLVFYDNLYHLPADNVSVTGNTFTGNDAILYMGWDLLHVDSFDENPESVPLVNATIVDNTFGPDSAVVLHHGLFGQVWDDNDLDGEAHLYSFYITRLQVIPPDGTPFWGAYDFVPTEGIVYNWPFGTLRWVEMDGELLYDVTDDTSKEADPPTLDVLLYALGSYRYVRGFAQVVPDADNDEATYPVLPDFPDLLKENLVYWPPLDII